MTSGTIFIYCICRSIQIPFMKSNWMKSSSVFVLLSYSIWLNYVSSILVSYNENKALPLWESRFQVHYITPIVTFPAIIGSVRLGAKIMLFHGYSQVHCPLAQFRILVGRIDIVLSSCWNMWVIYWATFFLHCWGLLYFLGSSSWFFIRKCRNQWKKCTINFNRRITGFSFSAAIEFGNMVLKPILLMSVVLIPTTLLQRPSPLSPPSSPSSF